MLFDDVREDAPKVPTDLLGGGDAGSARPPLARASSGEALGVVGAATTYTGAATSADPLQMLMSQKKADSQQPSPAAPAKPVTRAEHLENFMAQQMPAGGAQKAAAASTAADAAKPSSPAAVAGGTSIKATIEARKDIDGVTWYSIRLWDGSQGTFHQKRFSDFKEFDSKMRSRGSAAAQVLPELPSSGTLGLRHKLDVGDFNEKRQDGLQKWLEALTRNFKLNTVQEFFSRDRAGAPSGQPELASQGGAEEEEGVLQWQ